MLLGILLHAGLFLVPLGEWPVHEAWALETPPETNGSERAGSAAPGSSRIM